MIAVQFVLMWVATAGAILSGAMLLMKFNPIIEYHEDPKYFTKFGSAVVGAMLLVTFPMTAIWFI